MQRLYRKLEKFGEAQVAIAKLTSVDVTSGEEHCLE